MGRWRKVVLGQTASGLPEARLRGPPDVPRDLGQSGPGPPPTSPATPSDPAGSPPNAVPQALRHRA